MSGSGSFTVRDTTISFVPSIHGGHLGNDPKTFSHWDLYHSVITLMAENGFYIGKDPGTKGTCLEKNHRYARYMVYPDNGFLQCKSEIFENGFKFVFYQDVVHENPHGGYYDFSKLQKMPYLIRLKYISTINKIKAFLLEAGASDRSELSSKVAEERIKCYYATCWHHPQKTADFDLSSVDGETVESYNGKDRDGKTIRNGDIKYFRRWNGRLYRGKVYHNINNMWWVIVNNTELENLASFQLFDCEHPGAEERRVAVDRTPEAYKRMREELSKMSTKTLERELKRRRKENGQ